MEHSGKKLQNGKKELGSSSLAGQDSDPSPELHLKCPPKTNGPCLIRTKATRCNKVILNQELQPLMAAHSSTTHNNHMQMEAPASFVDSEGIITMNVSDFMVDFEIDENVFSDLMNMDISAPSCFENKVVAEEADISSTSTSDQQGCHHHYLSPPTSNDEICLNNNVSDDSILHSYEVFQSLSALMENEFDWL